MIEFEGDCRGINTTEALLPPWGCFHDEKEILVAPDQHFEVVEDSHKANQEYGWHASVTHIIQSPHRTVCTVLCVRDKIR